LYRFRRRYWEREKETGNAGFAAEIEARTAHLWREDMKSAGIQAILPISDSCMASLPFCQSCVRIYIRGLSELALVSIRPGSTLAYATGNIIPMPCIHA
jgi:hypothetical protein